MLVLILACDMTPGSNGDKDPTDATTDTADTGADDTGTTDTTGTTWPEGLAALTDLSGDGCPDLSEAGEATLTSNGIERDIRVYRPDALAAGAPAMFVWHPLGTTAQQIARYMNLDDLAEEAGAIILVPEAKEDNLFEWDYWNGLDDDLTMFDDLRTCLVTELGVDPTRISSHGMSAGGLMTTFMSLQRADSLATVSPFSGGTEPVIQWRTPAWKFPALVVYGGEGDTYGSGMATVNFEDTTLNYVAELRENEQSVVLCNHEGGHTIPIEAYDMILLWNFGVRFGETDPFGGENPLSDIASFCEVVP